MFATSHISAVILVSRVNSANPDISRNFCLAIWIFFRFQIVGLNMPNIQGHITDHNDFYFWQSKIISSRYFIDIVDQFRCKFIIIFMFSYLKNLYHVTT